MSETDAENPIVRRREALRPPTRASCHPVKMRPHARAPFRARIGCERFHRALRSQMTIESNEAAANLRPSAENS